MNRFWFTLAFILFLASCNSEDKLNYAEGFKKIWTQRDIRWNTASLVRDKEFLYGLTLHDKLFKAEIKTGKIIWIRQALPNYSFQKPLIINNTIFIGGRDSVFAYDVHGNLKWKQATGNKIGHTLLAKDSLLIGSISSKGLFALSQRSGNILWSIEPKYQMGTSSVPSLIDSLIIVGDFDYQENGDANFYCFNVNNRKVKWNFTTKQFLTSEAEVKEGKIFISIDSAYTNGYTKALDIQSGKLIWKSKTFPDIHIKPLMFKDKLFIGSYKHGLICLDPEIGKQIWTLKLNGSYPSIEISIFKDKIVLGTYKNELYIINLNGKLIYKTKFDYGLGISFIKDDTLYVNTGGGSMYKMIKNIP